MECHVQDRVSDVRAIQYFLLTLGKTDIVKTKFYNFLESIVMRGILCR